MKVLIRIVIVIVCSILLTSCAVQCGYMKHVKRDSYVLSKH
jgi:predicted small secreted protein